MSKNGTIKAAKRRPRRVRRPLFAVAETQAPYSASIEPRLLFGNAELTANGTHDSAALAARIAKRADRANGSKTARAGTFIDNLRLPVHRWFRYTAGFSARWVESVLTEKKARSLFDPFAGSGTALLAADRLGVVSVGTESHPFVQRIAQAKLSWNFESGELNAAANELSALAKAEKIAPAREADSLIARIYSPATLAKLERLRIAHGKLVNRGYAPEVINLLWLSITAILRPCSFAGTAQWQYVLPNKTKNNAREPLEAFNAVVAKILEDRNYVQLESWKKRSTIITHDAREPFAFAGDKRFDAVVTSPPYPNNYDYADATRLEMTFWKDITGWADLQQTVRQHLLRSCSQHAAAERLNLDELLADPVLDPIRKNLAVVCNKLAEVRLTKGGKKTYHTMIAAYFKDLGHVFLNLRAITTPGATVCFVIGDSAPYGIHVPAEKWLGELAIAAGFSGWRFEKLRDRNIKWENRVHDVPLHEGNLWIEG